MWEAFKELSLQRRTGLGPAPLTLTDIEAWSRLYRVQLSPWELDTLLQLDAACQGIAAEQRPPPAPKASP